MPKVPAARTPPRHHPPVLTAEDREENPLPVPGKCGKSAVHSISVNHWPRILILFCLCLQGAGRTHAQVAAPGQAGNEEPPRKLRLLAIGDAPPHREEIVDDVRIHLPPPPGSIPPRLLSLWTNPETRLEMRPQLGRWSAPVELPAGMKRVVLHEGEAGPEGNPWIALDLPASGDCLAILTRGGANPTWNTPAVTLLPDDPVSFPAGRVVALNFSAVEIPLQLGTEKLAVPARGKISRDPGPVEAWPVKAARLDERGRPVFFHQGELLLHAGERAVLLIYPSDGVQRRLPLKLLVLKERAPPLPLPPAP